MLQSPSHGVRYACKYFKAKSFHLPTNIIVQRPSRDLVGHALHPPLAKNCSRSSHTQKVSLPSKDTLPCSFLPLLAFSSLYHYLYLLLSPALILSLLGCFFFHLSLPLYISYSFRRPTLSQFAMSVRCYLVLHSLPKSLCLRSSTKARMLSRFLAPALVLSRGGCLQSLTFAGSDPELTFSTCTSLLRLPRSPTHLTLKLSAP